MSKMIITDGTKEVIKKTTVYNKVIKKYGKEIKDIAKILDRQLGKKE